MIALIAVIGIILIICVTCMALFGMLGGPGKSLFVGSGIILAIVLVFSAIIILLDKGMI